MVRRDSPTAGVTEPVIMELLVGARNSADFRKLRRLTGAMPLCQIDPVCDYAEGAALYKLLRNEDLTIRSPAHLPPSLPDRGDRAAPRRHPGARGRRLRPDRSALSSTGHVASLIALRSRERDRASSWVTELRQVLVLGGVSTRSATATAWAWITAGSVGLSTPTIFANGG
jgi:hypothetical protein